MTTITLKEAKQQLVDLYLDKENYLEELKASITDVLARLPEDTPDKKLVALKSLAAKEAKGKFKQLSAETEAMLELIEELSESEDSE